MLHRIAIVLFGLLLAGCSVESRKARHLERAERYFQSGKIDKAQIEYANVLRLDAGHKTAVRRLGIIYFDQGKPSQAYLFLKQAEQLDTNDLEVRLKLASLYLAGRRFTEVRDAAEYILKKEPGHNEALVLLADAARTSSEIEAVTKSLQALRPQFERSPGLHLALGTLAFRQRDFTEAEQFFKQAVRLGPDLALAHSIAGNFYNSRGKLSAAEVSYKKAFDLSPVRSARRLEYIDFKVRNGDVAAGKQLLEKTVEQAPDHLQALNRLAELALGEKKFSETSTLLRKVLGRDPQNFEALFTLGLLHLAQADSPKAITHFERMAGIFTNVPKVRYHLALAFFATNNTLETIKNLNQAIALDPTYTDAILLLAEISIRKGDTGAAIALLSDLVRNQPRLTEGHLLLAAAYRGRNDLDAAFTVYKNLAEASPGNPRVPLLMGGVLLQQNKTNQARAAFEKALAIAPNYFSALQQVIALDLTQKRFRPALARIQRELERNPNAPELHILLAKAHYENGELSTVEKILLRAIEIDPAQREPYVLLARLYFARDEHTQAIDRLKRLLAREPKDIPALMLLGMIHHRLKNFAQEREYYEKVLAINPRFHAALNNLAYVCSEHLNQLDRAFEMAQRARALRPSDPFAADTLGWILFKRREYPWALSLLQESADELFSEPEVLYHLGMVQYMSGYESAARASFQRALQLKPEFTGRDSCVRRLVILDMDPRAVTGHTIGDLEEQLASQKDDPVALGKLAAAYEHTGAYRKARETYERALALSPQNVLLTIRLAELHHQHLQDPITALELGRKARALAPDDPVIAHALGRIAFGATERSQLLWAHSLLQESARKLPDDPEVAFDLAWSWFALGQIADAESAIRAALSSSVPFKKADQARRFLKFVSNAAPEAEVQSTLAEQPSYMPAVAAAAAIYERRDQVVLARQAYETVLERFPLFVPAHKRLALIFDRQGDEAKALDHATTARERAPNDPEAAKILGIILLKRGQFARAAQLLRESTRRLNSDAELFYHLGMAHYRLRQHAESKEALRQAVALNVGPSMAAEANRLLADMP